MLYLILKRLPSLESVVNTLKETVWVEKRKTHRLLKNTDFLIRTLIYKTSI